MTLIDRTRRKTDEFKEVRTSEASRFDARAPIEAKANTETAAVEHARLIEEKTQIDVELSGIKQSELKEVTKIQAKYGQQPWRGSSEVSAERFRCEALRLPLKERKGRIEARIAFIKDAAKKEARAARAKEWNGITDADKARLQIGQLRVLEEILTELKTLNARMSKEPQGV